MNECGKQKLVQITILPLYIARARKFFDGPVREVNASRVEVLGS